MSTDILRADSSNAHARKIERIEQLALAYQDGDIEAGAKLIDQLHPMVMKMARLACIGRSYTHHSRLAVQWVDLWVNPDDRLLFRQAPGSQVAYEIAEETVRYVAGIVSSFWNLEDCLQECQIIILNLAKNYRQKGSTFLSYVVSVMPRALYDQVKSMARESSSIDFVGQIENVAEITEVLQQELNDPESGVLDENVYAWVMGFDGGRVFDDLTPEERWILYSLDVAHVQGKELARMMGCHPNTIYRRHRRAIEKLKKRAEELNLIKKNT